ncbi:hypothetical protein MHUMG1_10027 [Metarhizium humberi]|uniref:Uncharacterized protein n=1 Tax=Metarhizium humberi TaxID=2596975 RepID=A0A9P8M2C3_9HYPO|nr:hypothetical protein MHUMG1_10027 [Metarhizium humberi]
MADIGVNFTCTPKDGPDTLTVTHLDVKDQTGQQVDEFPALLRRFTGAAVTDAAKQLVDEQVAAQNEAAKEFTTGPERDFAKHFSIDLLRLIAKSNDRRYLRVFVRLQAGAPARNHIGYAIRAHAASKTGLEVNQILQVNTGWAISNVFGSWVEYWVIFARGSDGRIRCIGWKPDGVVVRFDKHFRFS